MQLLNTARSAVEGRRPNRRGDELHESAQYGALIADLPRTSADLPRTSAALPRTSTDLPRTSADAARHPGGWAVGQI